MTLSESYNLSGSCFCIYKNEDLEISFKVFAVLEI